MMQEIDKVCFKGKSGMINLQKISLFFVLIVLLGKQQVLGGCGSSKAASPDTADTADSSHSYRTHPAQKTQEHHKSDVVSETQTTSQLKTKEVQNGGAGVGATAPVQQREPRKDKPTKEEESIEPPLKEKPAIERQSKGRKNPTPQLQPPPRSKKEAVKKRREQQRQRLKGQTLASHETDKSLSALPTRRPKKSPTVSTAAGSRDGAKPFLKRRIKPKAAFSTGGEGAGKSSTPLKGKEPTEKGGLVKKKPTLPPLRVVKRAEESPQVSQKKQDLLITVSTPGDVRTDSAQSMNNVMKPAASVVKPLQSEQDKATSAAAPLSSALQASRLKTEAEGMQLTPSSPKKVASALEKPTERIQEKEREFSEFSLSLPGQTPPTGVSELGTVRREMSPALSGAAALILGVSGEDDGGKREKTVSKILETMKNCLRGNKLIPLGSESLAFYEKALMESKSASTRISTRNFRSRESTHMGRLLDILVAAPHLREIVFEDPFDFVYMGGAGKPDVKISLGDMIEKLTGSKSLQTISFQGLPREDQISDFIFNFKEFIGKDKTRKFTVIFKDVPAKQDADSEYRSVTTSLRSAFTDERVKFNMKE